ncbi:AsmA family protein [Alkalimarinus coralli]|uniref:AsmA family protein n=1 Tax=Alkalimarinus coralli TaxID=2935863 RepID=UPI00202B51D9|nr:AsmA-like C-terminal region-containing protein [Alkalimarinus coralli]
MDKSLSSRASNLLLILFLAFIVLLSIVKLLFPADDYRQQISQRLTAITGQPMEIIDELEWYLSPWPSLFAERVVATQSDVALEGVSISFSGLDLLLLKAAPAHIQAERITSISNLTTNILLDDLTVSFDESGARPSAFNFFLHRPLAHSSQGGKQAVNIKGNIKHLASGRYQVDGEITKNDNHSTSPSNTGLLKNSHFTLNLSNNTGAGRHLFDLRFSADTFSASANGELDISGNRVSLLLKQLSTPNMTLSGHSVWQRENASITNQLHSKRVTIPLACFEKPYNLNRSSCYDLIALMMIPGENTLQIDSLTSHQQTLKNINLDWRFADSEILINKATAKAVGGDINLDGSYQLASNHWHFNLGGQSINIEQLLRAFKQNPQVYGKGDISLSGEGAFESHQLKYHTINGEVVISDGKTELFNLEKELCTQVKGVVVTDSTTTAFRRLTVKVSEENGHLNIPYFNSELDGAEINGQGNLSQEQMLKLVMNVKINKEEWALCRLPRALTAVEWPLTCAKQLDGKGDCSINIKQMGISALLLAEDPERKDKAKQKLQELKESDKVKKVLGRLEKWLNE